MLEQLGLRARRVLKKPGKVAVSLVVNLSESEARIVLESLIAREREMAEVCATSEDEDLVARNWQRSH
jgi:hypothetical protein